MFGGGIYFAETIKAAKHKALNQGYLVTCLVLVGEEHKVINSNGGQFTFQQLCKMKKTVYGHHMEQERVHQNVLFTILIM